MATDPLAADLRLDEALLLRCARPVQDAANRAETAALAGAIDDWDAFGRLVWRHGMVPLAARALGALPPGVVPEVTVARLRAQQRDWTQRAIALTGELLGLLAALDAAGIPAIPYKGPTLAMLAYGNVALRHFRDLDILVAPADLARAEATLAARGYRQVGATTPTERRLVRLASREYAWARDDGSLVEIHWQLFGHYFAWPRDTAGLWARRQVVPLGGRSAQTFSTEDTLLILCAHGGDHRWVRLEWLADVAALVARHPALDWDSLIARARGAGALRLLLLGLALAGALLDASLPDAVRALACADRALGPLLARMRDSLFNPIPPEELSTYLYDPATRERWRDRAHYRLSRAFVPTIGDAAAVMLPASLLPLYFVVRPLRLAWLSGRRFARRAGAR